MIATPLTVASNQTDYVKHADILVSAAKRSDKYSFESVRTLFLKFVFWPAVARQDFKNLERALEELALYYPVVWGYLYMSKAMYLISTKQGHKELEQVCFYVGAASKVLKQYEDKEGYEIVSEIATRLPGCSLLLH